MRRLHRASTRFVVAVVSTLLVAGVALATTPLGDPRTETQSILKSIESSPDGKKVAGQPIDKAKQALDRAHQARAAGDFQHAGMLESLALEWAQTAQDLLRAAAAEGHAEKLEKQAADASSKARRAQALLEETVARRGRARERLEQLEQAGAHPTETKPGAEAKRPAAAPATAKPKAAKPKAAKPKAPQPAKHKGGAK